MDWFTGLIVGMGVVVTGFLTFGYVIEALKARRR